VYKCGECEIENRIMKKLVFVRAANVRRSPIAAALLDALAEDHGLLYWAESAGIAALEGKLIAKASGARETLEEAGILTDGHHARQISG
jgi:protein-tyrosine phosphatase